jgi:hypothetical protein
MWNATKYSPSEDKTYLVPSRFLDNLMNKRRQAADMTSSAISSMAPASAGTSAQAFGPAFQSNHQLSTQSSQTGNKNDSSSNDRKSSSMPGPIGAGNTIPGTHPALAPNVISAPVTSEQNKLPQPSGNVGSSTVVSNSQSQSHVPQQQVKTSLSVESLSSNGRPDGCSLVSSKSSGFMSKIFGKPKDSQEELQHESGIDILLTFSYILLKRNNGIKYRKSKCTHTNKKRCFEESCVRIFHFCWPSISITHKS